MSILLKRQTQPSLGSEVKQWIDGKQQRHEQADGDDEEIISGEKVARVEHAGNRHRQETEGNQQADEI